LNLIWKGEAMKNRLVLLAAAVLVTPMQGALADGPPEDEVLLAVYRPSYPLTTSDTQTSESESMRPTAQASASAEPSGVATLDASLSGLTVQATSDPKQRFAQASGSIGGPHINWSDELLYMEATVSYRLTFEQHDAVSAKLFAEEVPSVAAYIGGGFAPGAINPISDRVCGFRNNERRDIAIDSSQSGVTTGTAIVDAYARADCESSVMQPVVNFNLRVEAPSNFWGARNASLNATLTAYVSEVRLYKIPSTPCTPVARVDVQDNFFAPASVEVQRYDYVKFDFTSASNVHDVVLALHGSANGNDQIDVVPGFPIRQFSSGTHVYFCRLHGTLAGAGMAGTLVVN
jgi:plastocyanin